MKTSRKNMIAYVAGLIINVHKLSMLNRNNAKEKGSIGNARSSVCKRSSHIYQRDHRRRPNAAIHINTYYAKKELLPISPLSHPTPHPSLPTTPTEATRSTTPIQSTTPSPPGRRGMGDRVSTKPNKSGETHIDVSPAGSLIDVKLVHR